MPETIPPRRIILASDSGILGPTQSEDVQGMPQSTEGKGNQSKTCGHPNWCACTKFHNPDRDSNERIDFASGHGY